MTFCLNPHCPHPENPTAAKFCQGCGQSLWVAERYRAIRLLGQGGQGKTWLAESQWSKKERPTENRERDALELSVGAKQVIIKQRWGKANDPVATQRLQAEVKQLQRLGTHPQIPRLLDFVDCPWGQLLIQEYIQGFNLEQLLEREGAFTAARIQALLGDLLPVLEYIQSFRVIHRDIKPKNIIQPEQQGPLVLVDFTTLKVVPTRTQLQTGTVMGSAEYVAPEQAMGQAVLASDLYSLGVTCIHLLTGLPPFELYSVSEDRWVWRDFLVQPLDKLLGNIIDKLLAHSLAERYQTAAQVILDLQQPPKRLPLPVLKLPTKVQTLRSSKPCLLPWHLRYRIAQPLGVSSALAVSPSGQQFATGSNNGSLYLWDLPTGALIHSFKRRRGVVGQSHCDRITSLQFNPTGKRLYSASQDGTLKVWNLQTFSLIDSVSPPGGFPTAIVLIPKENGLVSADHSGHLTLWQGHPLTSQQQLTQHQDHVSALGISIDGQQLVSGSWDGTVRCWKLPQGSLQQSFKAHDSRVTTLALHPLGEPIISGGQDGQVKVWHLGSRPTCDILCRVNDGITGLALSSDARLVAVGTEGNTLTVWQGTTGDCLARLPHGWGIVAIAFSPDNQILISTSQDETISVWKRALEH